MKTKQQIRQVFWDLHPEFKEVQGRTQNDYNATIRTTFVDFVDMLARDGVISPKLASEVTL
ncbi:MAG: hypothetical protein CMM47_01760 [Rhodospirillaceae bacterium]|nr:hypothetical protein [Rhodospirillaceae bacterium]|tara:strand:- start:677 stop:859 length:183 start_codon:yes stop_codon:yes gene_type:complete